MDNVTTIERPAPSIHRGGKPRGTDGNNGLYNGKIDPKEQTKSGRPRKGEGEFRKALAKMNVEYFRKILTDEMELKFWSFFMCGNVDWQLGDEAGLALINPVAFQAFKLAVAYKRGLPIPAEKDDEQAAIPNIHIHMGGASVSFFREQAKAMGYKTIESLPEAKITEEKV